MNKTGAIQLRFFELNRRPLLIFFSLSLLLSACTTQKRSPDIPEEIVQGDYSFAKDQLDKLIKREMKQKKIVGISIALVDSHQVVWRAGYGLANKAQGKKITPFTRFRVGSLAKLMNTLAIMQLVEAGRLDLDLPVQHYLPEFFVNSRFEINGDITLRSLLTHHSGLPSDYIKGMWSSEPAHFDEALKYLAQVYVAQPVNTSFSYSNIAHDIIGAIIARTTAQKYEAYMTAAVLHPLGMKNSIFSASHKVPPTAKSYDLNKEITELSTRDVPAAGLSTNIEDLAEFMRFFTKQAPVKTNDKSSPATFELSNASVGEMFSDQVADIPLNFGKRMGLGWYIYDDVYTPNIKVVGHSGATVGQRALLKMVPNFHYGVVVLSNSKNSSASLHTIANKALALIHETKTGRKPPLKRAAWPLPKNVDLIDGDNLIGYYSTSIGLAKINRVNDGLKAHILGRTFDLEQKKKGGLFYLSYKLFGLFPIKLSYFGNIGLSVRKVDGRTVLVGAGTLQNRLLLGVKITPTPINKAWLSRVGRYRVDNALEALDIPRGGLRVREGFLLAYATTENSDKLEFVLLPKNDKEAIISGIGRGLGETVFSVEENGSEYLEFSGMHFSKVK
ncbi:MAG: CubicO group peptidase (beta-lactamase class C family) [Lentisphaeria bacterium]